jgi:death on curing protein
MALLFLTIEEALFIHTDQIDRYGGSFGVRDVGLLESAIAMAQTQFGGEFVHLDIYEMAACYLFHIAKNHPFLDGNKRTGLACALVFLDINGIEPDIENDSLFEHVLDVVNNRADKHRIAEVFRSASGTAE